MCIILVCIHTAVIGRNRRTTVLFCLVLEEHKSVTFV
jgi:hypothetical protein